MLRQKRHEVDDAEDEARSADTSSFRSSFSIPPQNEEEERTEYRKLTRKRVEKVRQTN